MILAAMSGPIRLDKIDCTNIIHLIVSLSMQNLIVREIGLASPFYNALYGIKFVLCANVKASS